MLTVIDLACAQKKPSPPVGTVSLVYDISAQQNLYANNADRVISIASMTKLFTALTVLGAEQNLSEQILVGRSGVSSPRIRTGMRITRLDLLSLTMVSSDNLAAKTLLEHYPGGYQAGLAAMNQMAQRLGAINTILVEPTGIMAANVSTAQDLMIVARAAALNPLFKILANQKQTEISVERTRRMRQIIEWVVGRSTNPFLADVTDFDMLVAKTGFTRAAGFCLVMVVEYDNRRYVLITAGHATKQSRKNAADELIKLITSGQYRFKISDTEDQENKDK